MDYEPGYINYDRNGYYYEIVKTPKNNEKDITGKRFGDLIVIAPANKLENDTKTQTWLTECQKCKRTYLVTQKSLRKGTKNCGCVKDMITDEKYIGKRFGRLTVLERDPAYKRLNHIKSNVMYYKCKCDCGNITTVRRTILFYTNDIQSCGCLKKEQDDINLHTNKPFIDITGQKFGFLTAIKRVENMKSGPAWLCKCDCGREVTRTSSYLRKKAQIFLVVAYL